MQPTAHRQTTARSRTGVTRTQSGRHTQAIAISHKYPQSATASVGYTNRLTEHAFRSFSTTQQPTAATIYPLLSPTDAQDLRRGTNKADNTHHNIAKNIYKNPDFPQGNAEKIFTNDHILMSPEPYPEPCPEPDGLTGREMPHNRVAGTEWHNCKPHSQRAATPKEPPQLPCHLIPYTVYPYNPLRQAMTVNCEQIKKYQNILKIIWWYQKIVVPLPT